MERRTAYLVAGGAALGLAAWWLAVQYELAGLPGEAAQLVNDALNAIVKGDRLTRAPYDKETGVVPGAPSELAAAAGLDVETYSLARLIASEEGRSSNTIKAAVAWAVVNHATQVGKTITDLLTGAKVAAHRGAYGTQRNIDAGEGGGPSGPSDRYASTANDPYDGDAQIAAAVLSGSIADITHGADQFDRPDGERDPDAVAADRVASGSELAAVDGIDPDVDGIRFWRRAA